MIRKIAEGCYVDEEKGELQFDIPELLRHLGYEDTPENRDLATALSVKASRQVFGKIEREVVTTSNPEKKRAALASQGVRGVKIRRSSLCPCGSGLKYKRCCLGNN